VDCGEKAAGKKAAWKLHGWQPGATRQGNFMFTLCSDYRDMSRGPILIPPMLIPQILIPVLMAAFLGGCGEPAGTAAVVTIGALNLGTIPVMQRTPIDAWWSYTHDQDCSVVRWDRGLSYCRPVEPPPTAPPFCSFSLAGVDCWSDPVSLSNRPRELADGALALTPAQEANRTRTWPEF